MSAIVNPPAKSKKTPSLFRNLISLAGTAIVIAALVSIVFLFLAELSATHENPYIGIFTYIIFPSLLLFGLAVTFLGALLERRKRRRLSPEEVGAYLLIDLNDPRRRRRLLVFSGATFVFLLVSAFGSYRAYEYTDSVAFCGQLCHSVMSPEFTAYQASPHARVRCVDCHVGPGAGWYVRSKMSGAYQLYSVTFNKYPRPVPTPVHNLRPAQDTCEQCHWPQKFFGAQLKIFNRFGYDEHNTPKQIRMLINTGGGSPESGQVSGIHWHMNIANEITYVATDDHRQVIPWVRMKDRQGNITEFTAKNNQLTPEQLAQGQARRMDCVDCHNRPSHQYVPPDRAVNEGFVTGRLDVSMPFLKQQAVEALTKTYATTDEAMREIDASLDGYYRKNYPDLYRSKPQAVRSAIGEVQRIFKTYIFPEMKVDWQTHPDNIGHMYFQGCFRCHDGQHVSKEGKVIRNECNICHTVLDQSEGGKSVAVKDGAFSHPLDMDVSGSNCADCHTGKGIKQ
ncbi:MAG TPA: NapC/NirT family cytochrome c [Blastocatellia bacterium]|nr:NapC/NirT family cytochrome c [Blastocatellia bacterium]